MYKAIKPIFALSLVIASLLCGWNVQAQDSETPIKMKDLPEVVRNTVLEQSKGATIRGLSREVEKGKTYYEVEMRINGRQRDVLIDSTGVVVEIEEQVALSDLPAAAKKTLEEKAGGAKISYIESITRNDSIVAYEAHLLRNGKVIEIKVAPDGKELPAER